MPLRTAARKIPDAVFLPVDADTYYAASASVMEVLRGFGVLQVMGWDEAFLGVRGDEPEALAHTIRAAVRAATELDCSVGIGHNKLQAKMATGFGKPAGVFRLTEANWFQLLGERDTTALWGVGAKTAKKLAALGITTVNQLASADPGELAARFGPATGPWLIALARGIGDRHVTDEPYVAKGRGRERTFQSDLTDWTQVRDEVAGLARELAGDRAVTHVTVKVRYAPFFTHTHSQKLPSPTTEAGDIEAAALRVLEKFPDHKPVRLLGVRVEFAV